MAALGMRVKANVETTTNISTPMSSVVCFHVHVLCRSLVRSTLYGCKKPLAPRSATGLPVRFNRGALV